MLPQMQPGDCLLYRTKGFWSWLIRVKTFSSVSHCEAVVVPGVEVIAARGEGVQRFAFKTEGLYAILRPVEPFDLEAAMAWFTRSAEGQGYHWWGLLRFFLLGKPSAGEKTKMFCSELLVRWYRAGGVHPFALGYDADKTSPGMFLASPKFTIMWTRDKEAQA